MTVRDSPAGFAPLCEPLESRDDLMAFESVSLAQRSYPKTTWEIVDQAAETNPHAIATTWVPDPANPDVRVEFTFSELRARVYRYANVFVGLGVDRTEAVAFLTPNVSRLLPAIIAAQAIGIAAPMNPTFDVERVRTLVETTGARVIVAAGPEFDEERWSSLVRQARRMGVVALLALRPDHAVGPAPALATVHGLRVLYLDDAATTVADGMLPGALPRPHDIAAYFHTGGTTGAPKVAAHTHANESFMAWSIAAVSGLGRGESILAGLPLFHVNGLIVTGLAPFVNSARSVWPGPLGWRDPALLANTWRLIERFAISAMSAVPTVYAQLATLEVDADISSLRTPIVGAAPLPGSVGAAFFTRTGVALQEGYGLTEAGCASSFTPRGAHRAGSVGRRLPYQRVAAASFTPSGAMSILPPGTRGELVISGPSVFAGYVRHEGGKRWLDSESVVDGWLRSGDIGIVDDDDCLWLSGRSKDLIIRGGHNIDPVVIEEALLLHPNVRAAAAIGRPDRRSGEVPIAFVVVDAAYDSEDGEELVAWAQRHIDEPAVRPVTVEIVSELPVTTVGKPFKPALRARAIAAVLTAELPLAGVVDAEVSARLTDHGFEVQVRGTRSAAERARTILNEFAIDAEVVHHANTNTH